MKVNTLIEYLLRLPAGSEVAVFEETNGYGENFVDAKFGRNVTHSFNTVYLGRGLSYGDDEHEV